MKITEIHMSATTVCSRTEGKFHPALSCSLFNVYYFPDEIFNDEDAAQQAAQNYINELLTAINAVTADWKTTEI